MNINQKLHEAYYATDYVVFVDEQEYIMRVGEPAQTVDALLKKHNCKSAAFITAYNPASQNRALELNEKNQQRLVDEIVGNGYRYFEGEGRAHDGEWPIEPTLLVLGLSQIEAVTIASAYGQNAYLWLKFGLEVELCYV